MPRILVVAPNWIGDALMAQPLFARLREKDPLLRIDALAPAWVAPVLRRMPEIAEVIEAPFSHGRLDLRARWRLGRSLRARTYDGAIVLPNSWKSALLPFFADIAVRSGYVGESRYGLLNLLYRGKQLEPMHVHYARLSEPPRTPLPEPLPDPRLSVDRVRAHGTAERLGIEGPYVVLCPGAEYGPAKRWPYYAQLADRLAAQVVLLGSANDREACAGVPGRNLAGQTTLDEAIDLIAAAELVVCNDSGLMHVAAALGRPQVAIFGSSSPRHTPPRSPRARIARIEIACSPCYARVCPLGHFRCMRDLEVERVLAEIDALGVLPSPAPPAPRAPREAIGLVEQDLPHPPGR